MDALCKMIQIQCLFNIITLFSRASQVLKMLQNYGVWCDYLKS